MRKKKKKKKKERRKKKEEREKEKEKEKEDRRYKKKKEEEKRKRTKKEERRRKKREKRKKIDNRPVQNAQRQRAFREGREIRQAPAQNVVSVWLRGIVLCLSCVVLCGCVHNIRGESEDMRRTEQITVGDDESRHDEKAAISQSARLGYWPIIGFFRT